MDVIEIGAKVLFVALLWTLLASPFLALAFFAGRAMKRRRWNSHGAMLLFSLAVAILVAPVPTPIITVFIPNGVALLDGSYYARLFSGNSPFGQLWSWVITSLVITLAVSSLVVLRYLRR